MCTEDVFPAGNIKVATRNRAGRTELKSNRCIELSEEDSLSTLKRNLNIYLQSDHVILHHNGNKI